MPKSTEKDLQFVTKRSKHELSHMAAGASLADRTGYSVKQLTAKAVGDRLGLARSILKNAELILTQPQPSFRTTVSRAYYSMYHTARALALFATGGDDYQEHSKLPASIPTDFPSRQYWENELKRARLERNRADYDPYPKNDDRFEAVANDLVTRAKALLPLTRQYLRSKGWRP